MMREAIEGKGICGTARRIYGILLRYGLTPRKMLRKLEKFERILNDYGCTATFPTTAVVLKRYCGHLKSVIGGESEKRAAAFSGGSCERIGGDCVELAVHGLFHRDISTLEKEELRRELREALRIFMKSGIEPVGFRAPYLKRNENIAEVVGEMGLEYDNSEAILWEFDEIGHEIEREIERIKEFYRPLDAKTCMSLPRGISPVFIPVLLPDDEILERLNLCANAGRIWSEILSRVYERGEIFVLQLHPERIDKFESALRVVLEYACKSQPPVWVASLKDIARWWKERGNFDINVDETNGGKFNVSVNCSDAATILLKDAESHIEGERHWHGAYKSVECRDFELSERPSVGVSPEVSEEFVNFLIEEGFHVEESTAKWKYGVFFEEETSEFSALQRIESSDAQVVRIWRWPFNARCALCITGDIDALTLWDFLIRIFELDTLLAKARRFLLLWCSSVLCSLPF